MGVCLDLLRWAAGVSGGEDGGGPPPPPIPVLGVCLGMQALALALGGSVERAGTPVHGRLSRVRHAGGCPLFEGIPSCTSSSTPSSDGSSDGAAASGLEVVRYHSLVVGEASLPACLVPTAWTVGATHAVATAADGAGGGAPSPPARPATARRAGEGAAASTTLLDGGRPVLMAIRHAARPLFGVQFHPESVATTYGARLCANFRDVTLAGRGEGPGPAVPPGAAGADADAAVAALLDRQRPSSVGAPGPRPPTPPPPGRPATHASTSTTTLLVRRLAGAATALAAGPGGPGEALFFALFGARHATADTFWLDSSSAPDRGRFSYMGGRGGALWRRLAYKLAGGGGGGGGTLTTDGARGGGPPATTSAPDALWAALDAGLADAALDGPGLATAAGLPFHFVGGWVGYLGYELRAECGPAADGRTAGSSAAAAPLVPPSSLPDAAWFFADRLVVVDHAAGDVYVVALSQEAGAGGGDAAAWVEATAASVAALAADPASVASAAAAPPPPTAAPTPHPPHPFTVRRGRATYLADVAACRAALEAGDSYELCLTTALERSPAAVPDPAALYRTLRAVNPAPYAAFLDFSAVASFSSSDGSAALPGPVLCCSSPERFLRGGPDDEGGVLEARPIKGTAPRVRHDPAADAAVAAALAASEKDRAENLMIVDLLRNDLGRVCGAGSVRVPGLMEVESFATVHQLVSTVVGVRRPGVSSLTAIRAAFPGGSMTGAPKGRSMDILAGLERAPRGPYSGGIGWLSVRPGAFDLNIVIRTAIVDRAGDTLTIGAGGAVVIQSTPEGEYEEMRLKAAALLWAVGQVDGGGEKGGGVAAAVVDD